MVNKPQSQNSPEDRDDWESLAEDLFGVNLHQKPPEPVEDDLLDPVIPPVVSPAAAQPEPAFEPAPETEPEPVAAELEFDDDDADDSDEDDEFDAVAPAGSPDDFWAALDHFATDELATPIVPDKEQARKADQKKIGPRPLVSGPVTNVPVARDEFLDDAEFGVGVLNDVDLGDSGDDSAAESGSDAAAGEDESGGDSERPDKSRRRRPRRRRRGRKKDAAPAAETAEQTSSDDSVDDTESDIDVDFNVDLDETVLMDRPPAPRRRAAEDLSVVVGDDLEMLEPDASEEDDDGSDDDSDSRPRYPNVPTWAQAISYLKRKSDSPRGETATAPAAEKKPGTGRRRSRGGGRRRRKPDSQRTPREGDSAPSPAAPPPDAGE